jgi:hypothetical protein
MPTVKKAPGENMTISLTDRFAELVQRMQDAVNSLAARQGTRGKGSNRNGA